MWSCPDVGCLISGFQNSRDLVLAFTFYLSPLPIHAQFCTADERFRQAECSNCDNDDATKNECRYQNTYHSTPFLKIFIRRIVQTAAVTSRSLITSLRYHKYLI
jgi:hypothetical protein